MSDSPTVDAQTSDYTIFFTARSDSDGSGIIDLDDSVRLYAVNLQGQVLQISTDDEDVARFDTSDDGSYVAYLSRTRESPQLVIAEWPSGNRFAFTIDDIQSTRFAAFDDALWVVYDHFNDNPPQVLHIEPTTGQIMQQVALDAPQSLIAFSPIGSYFSAFSPALGSLQVYHLPSLERQDLPTFGNRRIDNAVWAPTRNLLAVESVSNEVEPTVFVSLVDVTGGSMVDVSLAPFQRPNDARVRWSQNGGFLTVRGRSLRHAGTETPALFIIDVTTGEIVEPLPEVDSLLRVGWSHDDEFLLMRYKEEAQVGGEVLEVYALYETLTGTVFTLDNMPSDFVTQVTWSNTSPNFAFIGRLAEDTHAILNYDAAEGELQVYRFVDETMLQATLKWLPNDEQLIVTTHYDDPLASLLDVYDTVHALDPVNQSLLPLTPINVQVDRVNVQIR